MPIIPTWAWLGGTSTGIGASFAGTFVPLGAYRDDIAFSDPLGTGLLRDLDLVATPPTIDNSQPVGDEGLLVDGTVRRFQEFTQWSVRVTMTDGTTLTVGMHVHRLEDNTLYYRLRDADLAVLEGAGFFRVDVQSIELLSLQSYFASLSIANNDNAFPLCLVAGTRVRTPTGTALVEHLAIGDMVLTLDDGPRPVAWVGHGHVTVAAQVQKPTLRPILFRAGSLGDGLPARDLCVSPQHRMLVSAPVVRRMFAADEVLVAAKHLVGLPGIQVAPVRGAVDYWHVMFERHQVILAEDAPVESFYLGEMAISQLDQAVVDELRQLVPHAPGVGPACAGPMRPARMFVPGPQARRLAARLSRNRKPVYARSVPVPRMERALSQ